MQTVFMDIDKNSTGAPFHKTKTKTKMNQVAKKLNPQNFKLLDPFNAFLFRGSLRLRDDNVSAAALPLKDWKVVVKDNVWVKSWPLTCASRALNNFVPTEHADVVKSILEMGAEIVGKGNMDEFGMG